MMMMGPMMGGGMMMGPSMMGSGMMGPGMMWGYPGVQQANLNLSVDDVRNNLQRWIAMSGNSHLKVGDVTEKDANTITADIVTIDKDALVQRYDVNRRTGFVTPAA